MGDERSTITVALEPAELELIRSALLLLLSTLGHEEAEELTEVKALLQRLPQAA
jgi:hypothetical protein